MLNYALVCPSLSFFYFLKIIINYTVLSFSLCCLFVYLSTNRLNGIILFLSVLPFVHVGLALCVYCFAPMDNLLLFLICLWSARRMNTQLLGQATFPCRLWCFIMIFYHTLCSHLLQKNTVVLVILSVHKVLSIFHDILTTIHMSKSHYIKMDKTSWT